MANLQVKDAAAATQEVKATGVGSAGDPFITEHLETNSPAILTAVVAIQTAVEILDNIVSGSEAQVDVLTSALPTGAATEATLAAIDAGKLEEATFTGRVGEVSASPTANTILARLKDVADKLDTLETTNNAIQAAVEIIDNMISGAEAQVDVVTSALPTGAATEATLAAIQTAVELIDNMISGSEAQVDVVTMPASDRATDNMGVALQTDAIMDDVTVLTPKWAVINVAGSGDNTIVAAVASKKIRVLQVALVAGAAVNVRFEDGAGGTALTGIMELAANGGFVLPFSPIGWFETGVNTLLNLELSAAQSVDGVICYVEV